MKSTRQGIPVILSIPLLLAPCGEAWAQTATVDLSSQKQVIRGYGGMNHPIWAGDLTAAQRTTAFGNGDGQLGFTIVRMFVSENKNDWSKEVATGKACIAAGGLAFASPWNPPASMKSGGSINPSQFAAYATHLNDYVTYMKGQGLDLYAISVQNEPDYASEWTAWTPQQVLDFIKNHRSTIGTRLMTAESFQYRKAVYDPLLNDPQALANFDILGAHLYGTQIRDFPYPLFKEKGAGKDLWMTEVYYPNSNDNSSDKWPEALEVAYHVHSAMVEAEFQAYVWWYIRRQYGPMNENGTMSKRGASMAHFSKFVRPGFVRVDATKSPTTDMFLSAYKGPEDVVLVVVNRANSSKTLNVSISGTDIASYEKFTTTASKTVAKDGTVAAANGSLSVTLDAQSVTTLRGSGTVPGGAGGASGAGGAMGSGGATGAGGSTRADAGRGGAGGAVATGGNAGTGTGGRAGGDAGPDGRGAQSSGGAAGAGGAVAMGGMQAGTGGAVGTGGSAATGGSETSGNGSGGKQAGAGGAAGAASAGTTSRPSEAAAGCQCRTGSRSSDAAALAVVLALPWLAVSRRRRRAQHGPR